MFICTVDKHGNPGMPTSNVKKVRRLLKEGKAVIYRHEPFTIQLLYAENLTTQDIEVCQDAGYLHIGLSIKSGKHEFFHEQYDLLKDERQRHDNRRKNRRNRRGRKRYRKPRFDNRCKKEGWLAPSIRNKLSRHMDVIKKHMTVMPVTSVTVETASFDTQLLEAMEKGGPLPEGTDYQKGSRYGIETLRSAVFYRDGHTCLVCGAKDVPLRVHHIGFWKSPPDHTDRMGNLATACIRCHTPANHKTNGRLYGWEPHVKPLTGAAFMNTIRWQLVETLREAGVPVHATNGARTKAARCLRHLPKTHANDAYCMGRFRPKHRTKETLYVKRRRNNRILEKFYDAKYVDIRDGKVKSGSELSCNRTNRKVPRSNLDNERICRGAKITKGRRSIRCRRYDIRPGETVICNGKKRTVAGVNSGGKQVVLHSSRVIAVKNAGPVTNRKKTLTYKDGTCTYNGKRRKVLSFSDTTVTIYWQEAVSPDVIKRTRYLDGWMKQT